MIDLQVERIDPQTAANWLATMDKNRRLNPSRAKKWADAILRGEWELTGDTIKFDPKGRLIDGQHRLTAIVESNVAVQSAVARNVNGRAFAVFDTGMKRSLAQVLQMDGEHNATAIAAVINALFPYAEGHDPRTRTHNAPTFTQAVQFLHDNPQVRDSVSMALNIKRVTRSNATALAASHFLCSLIDAEDAATFFELLHTPVGLSEGDPILVLRNALTSGAHTPRSDHALESVVEWALIIKAWNAWRDGRHIERLNWKSGGTRREDFPEPH